MASLTCLRYSPCFPTVQDAVPTKNRLLVTRHSCYKMQPAVSSSAFRGCAHKVGSFVVRADKRQARHRRNKLRPSAQVAADSGLKCLTLAGRCQPAGPGPAVGSKVPVSREMLCTASLVLQVVSQDWPLQGAALMEPPAATTGHCHRPVAARPTGVRGGSILHCKVIALTPRLPNKFRP
jgi:hypothetical protein